MENISVCVYDDLAPRYAEFLRERYPQLALRTCTTRSEAIVALESAEVLVAIDMRVDDELVRGAAGLRWIHALTSGTEKLGALRELPDRVIVTSSSGSHGVPMSEYALLTMMALQRDYPAMLRHQASARWERWPPKLLKGRTACIVGVGTSGIEIARKCKAFEMKVVGISATQRPVAFFDEIRPRERLADGVKDADFVIVLVPYGAATHHLIDADVLSSMRRDAYLLNLARGNVVDEAALIRALASGQIAGAGLDVFAIEPLPAESPLWTLPNVIVSPHVAGFAEGYAELVTPIMLDNFGHYLGGSPMRNVVRGG